MPQPALFLRYTVPEVGAGSLVTVTAQVAVKPPSLVVAVIVAVPRLLPVTIPSEATDAMPLFDELQATESSVAVAGRTEALRTAAAMLCGEGAFCEFREAVEKCVKTRGDALMLIDEAEEEFRTRMKSGDMPAAMADRLELCEKARADIERDMDRNKALKRLRLELTGH